MKGFTPRNARIVTELIDPASSYNQSLPLQNRILAERTNKERMWENIRFYGTMGVAIAITAFYLSIASAAGQPPRNNIGESKPAASESVITPFSNDICDKLFSEHGFYAPGCLITVDAKSGKVEYHPPQGQ